MNPWGFFILALGALLLIMGVTGSFTKVKSAITGKAASGAPAYASVGDAAQAIARGGQIAAGAAQGNKATAQQSTGSGMAIL